MTGPEAKYNAEAEKFPAGDNSPPENSGAGIAPAPDGLDQMPG